MRNASISALFLLGFLVAPALAQDKMPAKTALSPGAEVEGKTLDQWARDLVHPDPSVQEKAISVIPVYGESASYIVPMMIKRATDPTDLGPRTKAIMALGIAAALTILVLLVLREIGRSWSQIDSIAELQQAVQALFAGVLLVVLGLELMDTLRNYFIEHRLRVEFLISVALIAVARHVIQLDYEHASPWLVIAIAVLIFSLAASYVGVRRVDYAPRSNPERP